MRVSPTLAGEACEDPRAADNDASPVSDKNKTGDNRCEGKKSSSPKSETVSSRQRVEGLYAKVLLVHFAAVAEVLHKFCFNRGPHV